jgi:hypothetical protein
MQYSCLLRLLLFAVVCRSAVSLQYLDAWGYLLVGLAAALPCVAVPLLLQNKVRAPASIAAATLPALRPTAARAKHSILQAALSMPCCFCLGLLSSHSVSICYDVTGNSNIAH